MLPWEELTRSDWLANLPYDSSYQLWYSGIYISRFEDSLLDRYSWNHLVLNDLVAQLKTPPETSEEDFYNREQEFIAKHDAIVFFADLIYEFLITGFNDGSDHVVLIPMPPSKRKDYPRYDDRIQRVVEQVCENKSLYAIGLPLLYTKSNRESFQSRSQKRCVQDIYESLSVDESLISPDIIGRCTVLIDDVLASGAHFAAARKKLKEYSINVDLGLFLAKVVENPDYC